MKSFEVLWITWEKQVRNRTLSARMGAEFVEVLNEADDPIKRYCKSILLTARILFKWRNRVVVTQNPSLILGLQALLLKPFLGYKLIIDAHNAGIYPSGKVLQFFANIIIRYASYIIVTNEALVARVESLGGRAILLPDPLPDVQHYLKRSKEVNSKRVLFICTWASDEPYFEVFSAATILPDITFYITGKSKGRELAYTHSLPKNIVLTGYLPDEEYHDLLNNSDVVIDLTTRENCLVCGGYEAVSARTPFIVSDTFALRHYFRSGCVYVENNAEAIAVGVDAIFRDYEKYQTQINAFKKDLECEWTATFKKVMEKIQPY